MSPLPDLRALLSLLRGRVAGDVDRWPRRRHQPTGPWARSAMGRRRDRWSSGFGAPRRQRRDNLGSALVQAVIAGLIAVIGALLLTSRLLASRSSSFSRSDVLAAREAAEYGLNELQAQLNSDQYAYLWVTKRNNWSTVSRGALTNCQVSVLDASGNEATSLPALPAGITSAKTIKTDNDATITYQLTGFDPPSLPDNQTSTQNQVSFCGENNATSAANFGNLSGGSALITVTGTVSRGNTQTQFKLSRRPHVVLPARQLAFSFMILGDAYNDTANKDTFGAASDIARLNYFDGNICYGKVTDSTCFTNPPLPKTTIGCYDLGSCLINNIDSVDSKLRSKYCADVKAKKKKKKGFTCNDFQQSGALPNTPTPLSEGFNGYTSASWNTFASSITCEIGDSGANDFANCESTISSSKQAKKKSYFPYYNRSGIPTLVQAQGLANNDLIRGCYFNNTSGGSKETGTTSTAINCLVKSLKITGAGKNDPNLIIYTTAGTGSTSPLLPVNIFLHDPIATTKEIKLDDGGIQNSDTSQNGWYNLRLLGKQVSTPADTSVSCAESTSVTSTKGNDLNGMFVWLPNAALNYSREASKDSAYMVVWVCKFTGPTKDKNNNKYSIITPLPESVVRAGLIRSLGSSFTKSGGGTYRGFGSEDTPVP